jgi:hypothetical protein
LGIVFCVSTCYTNFQSFYLAFVTENRSVSQNLLVQFRVIPVAGKKKAL